MTNPLHRTALLVFSLSASAERENKGLMPHGKVRSQHSLFSELIHRTEILAKDAMVDVIWVDENHQRGDNFGERLSNAYQDLFDAGYDNVISIGNDCPDLTTTLLKSAIDSLLHRGMVAGPSLDGGVYLLGFQKDNFDRVEFESMSWQQDSLHTDISNIADQKDLVLDDFPVLMDLDTYQDLIDYISSGSNFSFVSKLCSILFKKQPIHSVAYNSSHFAGYTPRSLQLRGPPLG